jgi:hypothetical protein
MSEYLLILPLLVGKSGNECSRSEQTVSARDWLVTFCAVLMLVLSVQAGSLEIGFTSAACTEDFDMSVRISSQSLIGDFDTF